MATGTTESNDQGTARHLRGSLLLVAGRVLAIAINFGVQVLTVRYLVKEDYGVFAFALSVAGVLSVFSSFGMDKAVPRFLAVYLEEGDVPRFWGALGLMLLTVCGLGLCGVAVFSAAWALRIPLLTADSGTQLILALMAGLALCNALDALFVALFAVLASPSSVFLRRHLLGPLLKLGAAVAVVASGGGLVAFGAGQLLAATVGFAVSVWMLTAIIGRRTALQATRKRPLVFPARDLFRYAITVLSGDLAFLLRGTLVPLLLGVLFFGTEVATYQAVVPVARLNEFVLMSFAVLFLPNAARLFAAGKHAELQELFEKTTLWVSLLSFPVFAGSFIASDSLPVLLFGEQYRTSGTILAVLALGFYANAAFGTNLRLLRATGKLAPLLVADAVLIGLALALVCGLTPRYGALGGAWAVCGTYCAQALLYQAIVAATTTVRPYTWRCLAPAGVGVAVCLAAAALRSTVSAGLITSALIAAAAVLIMLALFGRELQILNTFPEVSRLPIVRRWVAATSAREGNLS